VRKILLPHSVHEKMNHSELRENTLFLIMVCPQVSLINPNLLLCYQNPSNLREGTHKLHPTQPPCPTWEMGDREKKWEMLVKSTVYILTIIILLIIHFKYKNNPEDTGRDLQYQLWAKENKFPEWVNNSYIQKRSR
jgi:hypothetical protein